MGLAARWARRSRATVAEPVSAPETIDALVARGVPLDRAVVRRTRTLVRAGQVDAALTLATSLRDGGQPIGHVALGIVAFGRGDEDLAWSELLKAPDALWARYAPREFARAGGPREPRLFRERVASIVELPLPTHNWIPLVQTAFGLGDHELAGRLFDRFKETIKPGEESARRHLEWIEPWLNRRRSEPSAPPTADGTVSFAVTSYGHPGRWRASANLGDHIQTIASMGHLVRHSGARFSGPDPLVALAETLQDRVRPELVIGDTSADVQLMTVDRDASHYQEIPPGTWMLGFGWFMHPIFDVRWGLPFHRNLLPIFLSFHCNRRELLTEETIEYLREHGPIGCRDWTTVDILLSLDVPAFFSGCLTTTVSTVFPDSPVKPAKDAKVGYVDVKDAPEGAVTYAHSDDSIRFTSFTQNCRDALDLLETYRRKHHKLVTSRLHCYLPARSLGVDVDFKPKNRADIRFAGLYDLDDDEVAAMRTGILDLLEPIMRAILARSRPAEVYKRWRELTADLVTVARARHEAPPAPVAAYPLELVTRLETADDDGPALDVVVVSASTDAPGTETMIDSLRRHSSRRVRVWPLVTSGDSLYPLLTLPQTLEHAERVVVLPANGLVRGDVAELAELDLGGAPLAAPDRIGAGEKSGFGRIHGAGNRLAARREKAIELRRVAHGRHTFDFDALRSDVLVLDLSRWRELGLASRLSAAASEYYLTLSEALMFELGPGRARIPDEWAFVPTRMPHRTAKLYHWVDQVKPWDEDYTPGRRLWRKAAV